MGTCCEKHLAAKVRDYARNAQNGAVTVKIVENPEDSTTYGEICDHRIGRTQQHNQVFCLSPAEFTVSYFPK